MNKKKAAPKKAVKKVTVKKAAKKIAFRDDEIKKPGTRSTGPRKA